MKRLATLAMLTTTSSLAAMLALGTAAHAQQVGTASAVNPAATINMRTITIGSSISHMERIRTTASGSVQVLFVDKTSMTVGPNSDLTIDEYVFDPKSGEGKLAATLGKGALRFVGGLISHAGNAEIKTSAATIGIRGGVVLLNGPNVYMGYGSSTVSSRGGTVSLSAGEFTRTPGNGQPPSPPGPPPPNFVASQLQIFQSAGGQSGGVTAGHASPRNVAAAERRATGSTTGGVAGRVTSTPAPVITRIGNVASTLDRTIQTSAQSRAVETSGAQGRPTVTLSGVFGGVVRDQSLSGPSTGQNYNIPVIGGVTVALNAMLSRTSADDTIQFGSVNPSDPTASTYTDYNNFSAQVKKDGVFDSTVDASRISGEMSTLSPDATRQLGASLGQPNLTVCQCDYTRWGFWNLKIQDTDASILGTWAAGRPSQLGDMPTTGTASYVGHVIAQVGTDSGSLRQAVGNFSNTVDFGARTGSVAVTGL
ncbi:MAG: FecR domain-containing protein, partial [Hyphomicrobiales bacterium]|nr:FecR domain-containing protein [Hyphomicrobiales bacterium]